MDIEDLVLSSILLVLIGVCSYLLISFAIEEDNKYYEYTLTTGEIGYSNRCYTSRYNGNLNCTIDNGIVQVIKYEKVDKK